MGQLTQLGLPLFLILVTGCIVPQPCGEGQLERLVEPTSQRGYWRYLPSDYVSADENARAMRRWPLVVTFHGMKPFDGARAQAREWEQEADRYGFIVVAPELRAPDVLGQFPVRTVSRTFKSDEDAALAILDDVFAHTRADPKNVLSTGWSSGGYIAHYMLNQHPDRFTCVAVRQANFSASILDPQRAPESRWHPVLILNSQRDFSVVRQECQQATQWYEAHKYSNFGWVEIKDLGHERTPDTAAAFFAKVARVEPKRPPVVLTRRQAIAGNARGLAMLAGGVEPEAPATAAGAAPRGAAPPTPSRGSPALARASNENGPVTVKSRTPSAPESLGDQAASPRAQPARAPIAIRVSSAIGAEPLVLAYAADCPADWRRSADFLWTLNGETIGHGIGGQKTITQPGEHTLGLLVVTSDGVEHHAFRLIRVLPQMESTRSPAAIHR